MIRYDAPLLQKLTDKLGARAAAVFVSSIIAGMVTGCLFGYAAMLIFMSPISLIIPGLVVGAVTGALIGQQRTIALKLQAQIAACLIQIEANTRPNKKS
ncbi:MAG: hypothetical protein ABI222_09730 [Opitutaceae bacterium]